MKYFIIMFLSLLSFNSFAQGLDGGRWNYYPPACFPGIDAIDYKVDISEAPAGAIIWWCDYDNHYTENYRTSKNGSHVIETIMKDFRNSEIIIIYAREFQLRPTDDEMKKIDQLRDKFSPKCFANNENV